MTQFLKIKLFSPLLDKFERQKYNIEQKKINNKQDKKTKGYAINDNGTDQKGDIEVNVYVADTTWRLMCAYRVMCHIMDQVI